VQRGQGSERHGKPERPFFCRHRRHGHRLHQLRVEGLVIYYMVPHTLLPGVQARRVTCDFCHTKSDGMQAPFSIRVYSSHAMELQRVPSPRSAANRRSAFFPYAACKWCVSRF
jgi:hypothetical protein